MKRLRFLLPVFFLTTLTVAGQGWTADKLDVPLIDRELFFSDPLYAGAQLSPDGQWISFIKPHEGVMNVWVMRFGQDLKEAWPVTADAERPVLNYFWSEDSAHILHVQDQGGDENFHVYAVDPKADIRQAKASKPRDLTPVGKARAMIYAVPESTPDTIIVGLNNRDPRLHNVYSVSVSSGERKLLIENKDFVASWTADLEGNIKLATRQTPTGGTQFLRVDGGEVKDVLYECNYLESCGANRFHKDGKRVYLVSNKGEDTNLSRLLLLDTTSGKTEEVEGDPEGRVDFGAAVFSERTNELIATAYIDDRLRIYWHDKDAEQRWNKLKSRLPEGELRTASVTNDESRRLLSLSSDINPGSVYVYEQKTDKLVKLYDSRPDLPSEHLASMQAIRYEARDGTEIPAYLTLPRSGEQTGLPTVIFPHGGPWARDSWGYNNFAQFLANRGYAVLQPNFRGSAGFGQDFLNAGNKEWGTGTMQHDISDGVAYLVKKGIADPDRIAIMGGSYGGYATLAGLTFTPELYAAGVSIVGPSNLITLLQSIPPYWAPMKKTFAIRVGDLETEEGRNQLKSQSPFFHADKIKAPMLIVQGANDPRVKQAESDQIVVALREAKQPVEYLLAENEGHGYANEDNRMAMIVAIERFLAKHIGGRSQNSVQPEIASRLSELTVDVSSVSIHEED